MLGPQFWRHGLATEGVHWLVQRLEQEAGLSELWASADCQNAASLALMRRLSFEEQRPPWPRAVQSYDPGDVVMARLP